MTRPHHDAFQAGVPYLPVKCICIAGASLRIASQNIFHTCSASAGQNPCRIYQNLLAFPGRQAGGQQNDALISLNALFLA